MGHKLTLEQLSQLTGEPVARLQQWMSLRLIGDENGNEYEPQDVQRVQLIQLLLRRGVTVAAIVEADEQRGFLAHYAEQLFPGELGQTCSPAEASELLGLDADVLRRFWEIAGLSEQGDRIFEEDVQALKALKTAMDAGFPEGAVLQLARVYLDALGRVAEAEVRLSHFYVHERLQAQGLAGRDLHEASRAAGERARPLVEPLILYFHRKGYRRALREDVVLHVKDNAGLRELAEVPGQLQAAVLFVDLCSFTALADAMGDRMAVDVLERFSQLVREAVRRHEGRVVKQIGDAFMLVFPQPQPAVLCAVEIEKRTAAEPQFPAVRSGVHWGQVLYREGDYVGTSVNVAARLVAEAQRHQVLVTAAVRKAAAVVPDVTFVPLRTRRLKGLADELELFEVVGRVEAETEQRLVDPVCGMELNATEVAARLSLEGQEKVFCSQACLQRFVASPARYDGPGKAV